MILTDSITIKNSAGSNKWLESDSIGQAAWSNIPGKIGEFIGANFNTTSDQSITMPSNYIVRRIVVTNASASFTLAAGGFYTGASKTGTVIVAAAQTYTALTASTKYQDCTLASATTTDRITSTTIFLSLTVAQGTSATADIHIFGDRLS